MARLGPERGLDLVKDFIDPLIAAAITDVTSAVPALTVPTPVVYTHLVPMDVRVPWLFEPDSFEPDEDEGVAAFDSPHILLAHADLMVKDDQAAGAASGHDDRLAHRYLQAFLAIIRSSTAPTLANANGVHRFGEDGSADFLRFRNGYRGWRVPWRLEYTPDDLDPE